MDALFADFEVTLQVTVGLLRTLWGLLGITWNMKGLLWNHFDYARARFQRTLIFPTDLNTCMQLWGKIGATYGLLFV